MTRRSFGAIVVSSLPAARALQLSRRRPLAVQLYSVRALAKTDLRSVLAHVAQLGYEGVEFAGYYGHEAEEVRRLLDASGLKAAGSHVKLDDLLGDQLGKTVEFNRVIGNRVLVVPGVPEEYRGTAAGWMQAGKLFSEIAAKLKPAGFTLGYHNHAYEFVRLSGEFPFDIFFGAASQDVNVQLDIAHALQGGADPVQVLDRYRGRIVSVHLKDYSPENGITGFGEGAVKWRDVFHALESDRKIGWYISEEEAKSCIEYGCIAQSIQRIRAWM